MFCSNCGKELKSTYKFCPKCGKEIEKEENNTLYERVKEYVIENNKVSIALIEKEFKISKVKATKIIKELEDDNVVSKANGRKGRVVLISKDESDEKENFKDKVKDKVDSIMDTTDSTNEFDENDIEDNMFLAMLSYIGIFAFIPYFIKTDSKFVKYHAIRGINLLILEGIYTLLDSLLSMIKISKVVIDYGSLVGTKMVTPLWISLPMAIVGGILTVLSIIGIVNVCKGKAKELPLIGKIKIIK